MRYEPVNFHSRCEFSHVRVPFNQHVRVPPNISLVLPFPRCDSLCAPNVAVSPPRMLPARLAS
jgi:hypothetical protein